MRILIALFIVSFSWVGSAQNSQQPTTTYFFIRHAEKDLSNPKDHNPKLTESGKIRSKNWAKILEDTPIDYVYTTDYIRTKKTAAPIAKSKGLEMKIYNPKKLNDIDFQQNTIGKTTVVVGHSNTTPTFVNKIIGKNKYNSIDETIYGKLFIVKITGEVITDTVLIIN
ncbi:SixA phosphatase family protein [Aquimarina aquimarini]|uniref:SixA phosphatase family protein n=1 Tax=Aquimarina aquimarini TaxID=1191734 RepID=UPI000D55DB90|nr:histidine phosphatase family protein [Aquimarina aquimarini]